MAAIGRLCLDGSGFQFQPLYQKEVDGLLIVRCIVQRADLSSGLWRGQQWGRWASLHDLHHNDHGHIGIYAAFYNGDPRGSVAGTKSKTVVRSNYEARFVGAL